MRGVRRWLVLVTALVTGCGGPPPPPPTAVIDASPSEICAGDAFTTPISLSGARSSLRLSLVPSPPGPDDPPLSFEWRLEGDAHRVIAGALDEDALSVLVAGERPLHATLTVTTFEGGLAQTLRTIGVNVPLAPPCEEGCPDGTSCVELRGESVCLPDPICASDDDCDGCFACDANIARCAPPEGS